MRNVLEFWHTVEFFQCYDLQEKLDFGQVAYTLYDHQLKDENLPWIYPYPFQIAGGSPGKKYRYHIYFLLFDRNELIQAVKKQVGGPQNVQDEVEWQEKLDDLGASCFAKMVLHDDGTPDWDAFSLSTLPWALGHLIHGDLKRLSRENFENDVDELYQLFAKIPLTVMDSKGIAMISQALIKWARYCPKARPIVAIELKEKKGPKKESLIEDKNTFLPALLEDLEEQEEKQEIERGILNSFYINDIEKVLLQGGEECALAAYMAGTEARCDLNAPENTGVLEAALHPNYFPTGRYGAREVHPLPLMQHFALNKGLEQIKEGGLFSINGPPGTGKTTLVREVISHFLIERAFVLSAFLTPQEAFVEKLALSFGNHLDTTISRLHPSLTGFEIVIASSNNGAVENISKELPRKAFASENISYLEKVANKIIAKHSKKGEITPPDSEHNCWGLISSALGNLKNCRTFLERGFILKSESQEQFQTVWQWAKSYRGKSFDAAKKTFLQWYKKWNAIQTDFASLFDLVYEKQDLSDLSLIDKKIHSLEIIRPDTACSKWEGQFKEAHQKRLSLIEKIEEKKSKRQSQIEALLKKYPTLKIPKIGSALQHEAYWQSDEQRECGKKLFAAAIELHEAWLASVLQKGGGFGGNVFALCQLLAGKEVTMDQYALPIWQSLFLLVPVISTTFASMGRLFKSVKEGELGLVVVDEAGQAVPQAPVGAFWRAKRAIVMGDPQQIEPVMTIPPVLVDTLAKEHLGESWSLFTPTIASCQTLADRANPFGVLLEHEWRNQWIGCPLRVHRRCQEPMFTIANEIAYGNAMVSKVVDKKIAHFTDSAWFDLKAATTARQFVPAQAEFVLREIKAYFEQEKKLPDLYIISPFKKVKQGMSALFSNQIFAPKEKLKKWVSERIGTVHTFQGKEESIVFFVLGCDATTQGAVSWACQKPNLLNVAVTRAKHRLFVVGDADLWGEKPYFQTLIKHLPVLRVK